MSETGEKIDQVQILLCGVKSFSLHQYLSPIPARWEAVDNDSARLIVPSGKENDSLDFKFDPQMGLITQILAMRYKGQNEEKTRWLIDITEWMTSHYVKIHSVIGKNDVMTAGTSTINRIILPIRSGIDPMEGLLNASFKGDPEFEGLEPQGRKVELLIQEKASGKHGFSLLAPVGAGIKEPRQLFLVYMPCINLVRRTGSLFEGRIGDLILRPESLPILLNWRRVWFVRYAAKPVIGTLNPPMGKPLIIRTSWKCG